MDIEEKHWVGLGIATAATVLGGLILRGLGYLDDVVAWVPSAVVTAGSALSGEVAVPGWLLLLGVALMVFLAWAAWPRLKGLLGRADPLPSILDRLDILQYSMLLVYLSEGERELALEDFTTALAEGPLRVEKAADAMCEIGVLERNDDPNLGAQFRLRDEGRDLVLHAEEVVEEEVQKRVDEALEIYREHEGHGGAGSLTPEDLTDREERALRAVAMGDGAALSAGQLAEIMDERRLWAEAAIDDLEGRGLIEFLYVDDPSKMYELTSSGRNFVLEQDWVE